VQENDGPTLSALDVGEPLRAAILRSRGKTRELHDAVGELDSWHGSTAAEIIVTRPDRPEGVWAMSDSVYRVTEVIGTSTESWEAAARNAVETAGRSIRDLRVAEATRFDVTIKDGTISDYRVRLDISFKYEAGD